MRILLSDELPREVQLQTADGRALPPGEASVTDAQTVYAFLGEHILAAIDVRSDVKAPLPIKIGAASTAAWLLRLMGQPSAPAERVAAFTALLRDGMTKKRPLDETVLSPPCQELIAALAQKGPAPPMRHQLFPAGLSLPAITPKSPGARWSSVPQVGSSVVARGALAASGNLGLRRRVP